MRGVVIRIMAFTNLTRAPMAAPVMGNNAIALAEEKKQLCVPVICAQWPTVMKDDRLRIFRTPRFASSRRSMRSDRDF